MACCQCPLAAPGLVDLISIPAYMSGVCLFSPAWWVSKEIQCRLVGVAKIACGVMM